MKLSSMKPWKRSWRLAGSSRNRWSRSSGSSSCWRNVRTLPLAGVERLVSSWFTSWLLLDSPRGGVESLDPQYCASQHEFQARYPTEIAPDCSEREVNKQAVALTNEPKFRY